MAELIGLYLENFKGPVRRGQTWSFKSPAYNTVLYTVRNVKDVSFEWYHNDTKELDMYVSEEFFNKCQGELEAALKTAQVSPQ